MIIDKKFIKCWFKSIFLKKYRFVRKILKQSNLFPQNYPVLKQRCLFIGKGNICFGENVNIGYYPSPQFYSTYAHIEARGKNSKIFIDDNTMINNNCCIISNATEIKIGKNCRIGINFQCYDSDFHGIKVEDRDKPDKIVNKDVIIGDNVFIGNNVIVLKGVKIGDGCTIGAGSVVTQDVPPNSITVGASARIVKKLENYYE